MTRERDEERIAAMNPSAVKEAKVFSGLVYYFNGSEHVDISDKPFVEVGRWTCEGAEQTPEDYDCTYYAAVLLGYEPHMSWLPAQEGSPSDEERTGERKYLIHSGVDESGRFIPFSPEEASKIAEQINFVVEQAHIAKTL
jgi:hypothetical protein